MKGKEQKFRAPKQPNLSKLTRKQLLELLLCQTQRVEELESELAALEKKLRERRIAELEAGSIAEAALKLNGVFEAAQAAADQYLENVRTAALGREENGKEAVLHEEE